MKTIVYAAAIAALAIFANDAHAQRVEVRSGNVDALSGQKTINVEYDYSSFGVGKFATEQEYLDKKAGEYNAKEAGKGDSWKKTWVDDRKDKYELKFEELLNKGLADKGIMAVHGNSAAKYTLIVRTKFVEPGFNVGVVRKNATVDFVIDLVESANKSGKVAEIALSKVPGGQFGGYDFETGVRIAESYAKAGKTLAAFIEKQLK